jgi:cytochrome c peroxidase
MSMRGRVGIPRSQLHIVDSLTLHIVASITAGAIALAGCSGAEAPSLATHAAAVTAAGGEDGLAEAYGIFKQTFVNDGEDQRFHIGFGYHPGLSTTQISVAGAPVSGQATIDFQRGVVSATLTGPVDGSAAFDLYFVKNALGHGSVKPEAGDSIFKVGSFQPDPRFGPNAHRLEVTIGTAPFPARGVNFDLDLIVVTLRGQRPTANIVAAGARTLFEKRFFRERAGAALDAVVGTLANDVETNDPLVRRGSQLFFAETFGGNGRTCGTCHRLDQNLTLDASFIATLPGSDALFAGPEGLEDGELLANAIIRENLDGFDAPTVKFTERSIPHTLAMSTSIGEVATAAGFNNAPTTGIDGPPPDQRTGWSGDGAPGRGTMNEFAFGAIVQHFPITHARVPGRDFRLPTQEELDALEAFQLFSGRQKNVLTPILTFGDPVAQRGMDNFLNEGQCVACHRDIIGDPSTNFNFDTGVENLSIAFKTLTNMPKDGGFGVAPTVAPSGGARFGNGRFNVPPLFEAADTGPFFHNNAKTTIEDAVSFYASAEFLASPGSNFARPNLDAERINNIGAYLRTINALTNIAQVRKRVLYLLNNSTPGGTTIAKVALADVQDAIDDLSVPTLQAPATVEAIRALRVVKLLIENSMPFINNQPVSPMIQASTWLDIAKRDLAPGNPNNDF